MSYEADFEFVERKPIEAVFEINPIIGDLNYIHYQDVPSDRWRITHKLGKYPSVTVVSSSGDTCYSNVTYIDINTLEIDFMGEFSGRAYLN